VRSTVTLEWPDHALALAAAGLCSLASAGAVTTPRKTSVQK